MRNRKIVKTPTVFQMEATECGAACLSMILRHYGKQVPNETLRAMIGVSRDGSKAGNMMRAGQALQMEVHGYRREAEELYRMQPPFIVHWNFNHFVVYEGHKGKYVFINDPAAGRRKIRKEEFEDSFTGIVLIFQPGENFRKEKTPDVLEILVRRTVKENKGGFLAIFLIGLLLVVPGFLTSALAGFFTQKVLAEGFTDYLPGVLIGLILILLFQTGFSLLDQRIMRALQNKVSILSAKNLIEKMFRLPVRFFELRFAGDLSTRLNHSEVISQFLTNHLTEIAVSLVEGGFFGIILLYYSPLMTLIALTGITLQMILVRRCAKNLQEYSMKLSRDIGKTTGMLYAGLAISDSLKTGGGIEYFLGRLLGSYSNAANMKQKTGARQKLLGSLSSGIMAVIQAGLLLAGGILVMDGHMSLGQLVAFLTLFSAFMTPVQKISSTAGEVFLLRAEAAYIQDIMDSDEEPKYQRQAIVSDGNVRLKGSLTVRNLEYGYSSSGQPLIHNFSLEADQGEIIALVGASGSGKSTVAKLISGLLEPWNGEIELGGIPTKNLPKEVISLNMAAVSQNIHIFEGTIRENLTLWNHNCSAEDLTAAAKDACIHEEIMKRSGGYDFYLSRNGSSFSGGERQRLEIARALVTNPGVLILDEATSALDSETEAKIMENIRRRGCTCIISAHRLSTVSGSKEIIFLKEGEILARGTHEELFAECEAYRELVRFN